MATPRPRSRTRSLRAASLGLALHLVMGSLRPAGGTEMGTPELATPPERVSLTLRDLELEKAIESVVRGRAVNLVQPPGLTQKVTVRLQDVPWRQALDIVLEAGGHGLRTRDDVLFVVPRTEVRETLVTRTYPIRYFPVATLEALLPKYVGASGSHHFVPRPPSGEGDELGTLVVTETPSAQSTLAEILRLYDIPRAADRRSLEGPSPQGTYDLRLVGTPVDLALAMLCERTDLNLVWVSPVAGRVTVQLGGVTQEAALDAMLHPLGYAWSLAGRVLTVGQPGDLPASTASALVQLEYASAQEVGEAVRHLLSKQGSLQIVGDPARADRLIVTDLPEVVARVRELAAELDMAPQQILVDLVFADVDLSSDSTLGIDWSLGAGFRGASRDTRLPFSGSNANIPAPTGFDFGIVSAQNLSATFAALRSRSHLRILSEPSLTTQSNRKATILVGSQFPITRETFNEQSLRRTITLSEYRDVGIKLEVLPRATRDGLINMHLKPSVASVGELIEDRFPIIETREAETHVVVRHGQAAVLGGLVEDRSEDRRTSVPGLSRVPLLGQLFKSHTRRNQRSELLIFVIPRILESPGKGGVLLEEQGPGPLPMPSGQAGDRPGTSPSPPLPREGQASRGVAARVGELSLEPAPVASKALASMSEAVSRYLQGLEAARGGKAGPELARLVDLHAQHGPDAFEAAVVRASSLENYDPEVLSGLIRLYAP